MKTQMMTLLVGIAIGATMVQGVCAQTAKPKAYSVGEHEIVDAAAQADYLPAARKAIDAAHGRALLTAAGRVVQIEGAPAPRVWRSSNGTAWMTQWHSTSRRRVRTSRPRATRRPKLYGDMSSKSRSSLVEQ